MAVEPLADIASPSAASERDIRVRVLGACISWLLRLRHLTWRKNLHELAAIDDRLRAGERVLTVFWHGSYAPLFSLLSGRRGCVFASQSFRGRVIAEICRHFGYVCVLLPERGGRRARELIREGLSPHRAGAFAVDGPLGPYHAVKPGAIEFASELGFRLLPVAAAADRARVHDERWDRMEVPRLFSRVYLAVGEPVAVPPALTPEDVATVQQALAAALHAVNQRARLAVGKS